MITLLEQGAFVAVCIGISLALGMVVRAIRNKAKANREISEWISHAGSPVSFRTVNTGWNRKVDMVLIADNAPPETPWLWRLPEGGIADVFLKDTLVDNIADCVVGIMSDRTLVPGATLRDVHAYAKRKAEYGFRRDLYVETNIQRIFETVKFDSLNRYDLARKPAELQRFVKEQGTCAR